MNHRAGAVANFLSEPSSPLETCDGRVFRVFVIGSGAREHAIAWKLAQSDIVDELFIFQGNGGTMQLKHRKVRHVLLDLIEESFEDLADIARENKINLVVVNPVRAVFRWIDPIEHFRKGLYATPHMGIPCFCPTPAMTKFEGNKSYAKDFMTRHNIPTAPFATFEDLDEAIKYVRKIKHRVVIKSDEIVKNQRVFLPEIKYEAYGDLNALCVKGAFGRRRGKVVIEKYLDGREISAMCFSDGKFVNPLGLFCNRKHAYDGARGLLTSGMGAYAPPPFLDEKIIKEIDQKIIQPTFLGFREDGIDYRGCLLVNMKLTKEGPTTIGYNVMMGDPETQNAILMLSGRTDLLALMLGYVHGALHKTHLSLREGYTCSFSVETKLHFEESPECEEISFGKMPDNTYVFYDSVARSMGGSELRVVGPRLCTVTARGASLEQATWRAYKGVEAIRYPNKRFRQDIASPDADWSKSVDRDYA